MLTREMPFAAVARLTGGSRHRVAAICRRYVDPTLHDADFSGVTHLAIGETSRARGHDCVTQAADAAPERRAVLFVTEGVDAGTIQRLADDPVARDADPEAIESVGTDMSPAFIKDCRDHLPEDRITFDRLHGIAHAPRALDETRRLEQKPMPERKGLHWRLLRDFADLGPGAHAEPDACSRVEPTKRVSPIIRGHFEGITAWAQSRLTNGFLEALNGLFQSARRRTRGHGRFSTSRTTTFLFAGQLGFSKRNPHVLHQSTRNSKGPESAMNASSDRPGPHAWRETKCAV